ncbi:fumarate hydratase (plasmid) [Parasedimentitalea marina]|uniref:Fumarate hydratase n=1 Tax=Parasedimentitalea marina TaxID=2483033 RepID=A0A3T0NA34_9RHOB|nr:fumarate hydratase [Parasedimentitalea marina]AZV80851.1 fumarate hydratase [Parasedimentitalea marina]
MIQYETLKRLSADLYDWSLKKIPEDTKQRLAEARDGETGENAKKVLEFMIRSSQLAEDHDRFLCSDAGVPVYSVKIGSQARFEGHIKSAFAEGFDELVDRIDPPLLKFVQNPLTNERSFKGKDMPIVSWDVIDGADYIDITCSPKALGSGRWASLEIFVYPELADIEEYILKTAIKAGSQHCPPVMIGVGIGGSFDHAAKMAKMATLRPMGTTNEEPILADMETRLLKAINKLGFGPMGQGGDTTALGIHIDYSAGHGFTPVAVCFNCWINRRTRARIYNSGKIERIE